MVIPAGLALLLIVTVPWGTLLVGAVSLALMLTHRPQDGRP